MADEFAEVAEAVRVRKEQIRARAQELVEQDKAVTFLPDGALEEPISVQIEDAQVEVAPEADNEPGPAVGTGGERPEIEPVEYPSDNGVVEAEEADEPEEEEEATDEAPSQADESPAEDEVDEPSKSANKGEWVAYRMSTHGLTEDQANEYSKQELIDLA